MGEGLEYYRRFLNGDRESFEKIVELYSKPLTFFLFGYVHNLEDAEDLLENVFASLIYKKRKIEKENAFKAYLYATARNQAISFLRKSKRTDSLNVFSDLCNDEDVVKSVVVDEQARALSQAMKELGPTQREVLYLFYFQEMSYEEISKILKINRKQVDNLAFRGKAKLKILLKEGGVFDEEQS